jgi:hypothetical protein
MYAYVWQDLKTPRLEIKTAVWTLTSACHLHVSTVALALIPLIILQLFLIITLAVAPLASRTLLVVRTVQLISMNVHLCHACMVASVRQMPLYQTRIHACAHLRYG